MEWNLSKVIESSAEWIDGAEMVRSDGRMVKWSCRVK